MIKLLIVSDSHGNVSTLNSLKNIMFESDFVIHLGDYLTDMNMFADELKDKLIRVKGNCDVSFGDSEIIKDIGGKKFLITHGHRYRVKNDLTNLSFRANEAQADVVLYGHTHVPSIERNGNLFFINPGSLYNFERTYCYAIIENNKIFPKIVKI